MGDLANIKNTEEVKIKLSKSITWCGSSASRQMSTTHIQFNLNIDKEFSFNIEVEIILFFADIFINFIEIYFKGTDSSEHYYIFFDGNFFFLCKYCALVWYEDWV